MGTIAGIGRSEARDPAVAGREAASRACAGLGGANPDLCLVFATSGYDQAEILTAVASAAGGARISGCSGEGVIAGPFSDESEHAIAVLAVRSDVIGFETSLVEDYAADPGAAGSRLAAQVRAAARGDEFGLLVLPDGLVGDCTEFLAALDGSLPAGLPVAGGTAADALLLERTWQYHGATATSGAVAAVLLRGRARLEVAVSHGCSAIGLERTITRGAGGWLHEIDGRPAWTVFKEYLDGDPQDLHVEGIPRICIGQPLPAEAAREYEPFITYGEIAPIADRTYYHNYTVALCVVFEGD